MADELNIPTHRWYQKRNHIALAKEDFSRQFIYDSGIQKIDAWINSQPWGDVYIVNRLSPKLVFDFDDTYYRTGGTATDLVSATNHTRAGNATMVDSDGVLKWAPHNLVTYSEEFDNAAWTKQNTSVTANSASAPDGSFTASTITDNGTNAEHRLYGDFGGRSQDLTKKVWVKAGTAAFAAVSDGIATEPYVIVNLLTGAIEASSGAVSVTSGNDGWYLLSVSPTSAVDSRFLVINMGTTAAEATPQGTYTGSGDTILVWGAHVYRSDLGGMVNNPETGDSYVRTAGRPIGPELVTNGTFDSNTSGWTTNPATDETLSTVSGKLRVTYGADGSAGNSGAFQSLSGLTVGAVYKVTIGERSVGTNGAAGVGIFTTSTGTGQIATAYGFSSATNEHYEFVATATTLYLKVYGGYGTAGTYVEVDNISVKEIDVNPAVARYLPRTGHHIYNGSAWVDEGYFHESEARTNLVTNSNSFTPLGTSTVTANSGVSPTGETNALLADTVAASSSNGVSLPDCTINADTSYTTSLYVKNVAGNGIFSFFFRTSSPSNQTKLWFNLNDGTKGTQGANGGTTSVSDFGITEVGNGWYRLYVVGSNTVTTSLNSFAFSAAADNSSNRDGDGEVLIYGAQVEEASTPSSYIPTNSGATVTRAADTLTVPSANLPWPEPVVIGDELVTNGTFDTDTSGWTGRVANNTIISNVSQALRVEVSSTPGVPWAYQSFTTEVGKVYQFSIEGKGGTATGAIYKIGTAEYGTQNGSGAVSGVVSGVFVATATSTFITLEPTLSSYDGSRAGDYWDFDNISVREINPLAVSIQMEGTMTYADEGLSGEVYFYDWPLDTSNFIRTVLDTGSTQVGSVDFFQRASSVTDSLTASDTYSPGINVPFNISSRNGSTFINGAVDGTALTANTTPTALPDLSSTDMQVGSTFMGTIKLFRVWADDLTDAGIAEATT